MRVAGDPIEVSLDEHRGLLGLHRRMMIRAPERRRAARPELQPWKGRLVRSCVWSRDCHATP